MAVAVSIILFVCAAPFAKIGLPQIPAFVPIYVASLVICDIVTAVLLFGQYSFLRSRGLLILACAYSFTAAMTTSYVLIFPGLFAPTGLLGAGPQTTSAMYIFWHAGFPLLVMAYALSRERTVLRESDPHAGNVWGTIVVSIAAVLAIVVAYTALATAGNSLLPAFLLGNRTTALGHFVLFGDWLLSLAALIVLWRKPQRTVLDVWLMVVMCVWLADLGLAAILNSGRYDLGWYSGRIYGLLAASCLLVVLLIENGRYYARLVLVSAELRLANETLAELSLSDALTKLANRRSFDGHLTTQMGIARRHERTLALVLFDVDSFKGYNDRNGHQSGDVCLAKVAAALQLCCRRPSDMAARYGGEEFALILPDTDLPGAIKIAEVARQAVALLAIPNPDAGAHLSISGGVAVWIGKEDWSAEALIAAADRALFRAKKLGRNQICWEQAELGSDALRAVVATRERMPDDDAIVAIAPAA